MKLNKLIGDKRVTSLFCQDLEIHFGAFGDISAAGATVWRRSEGHERMRGKRDEDVPEEERE